MGMDIDDALVIVGGYKRYHLAMFALLGFAICMPLAWCTLGIVIIGWEPPHHCRVAGTQESTWNLNESLPYRIGVKGDLKPAECEMYRNGTDKNETQICFDGWVYDTKYITIVNEWDLVCGQNFLAELSQTIMQTGSLAGEMLVAFLIDRIGRKHVFFSSFIWIAAFGVGVSLAPNYTSFIILQACVGMGISICVNAGFLLEMELFDASMRTFVGMGIEIFWVVSYLLLPLIGYMFYDWRNFQLFVSLSCLLWVPLYWIIPESPLWLSANRKYDKTEKILQIMAKRNGVKVEERLMDWEKECSLNDIKKAEMKLSSPLTVLDSAISREEKRSKAENLKFTDLFTDPKLLRHTILCMLLWFANMVVYYGIILLTPTLAGDRFINTLLGAVVEIPAYIAAYIICYKCGRRLPTTIVHVLAGISLLGASLIPNKTESGLDLGFLILAFALGGKFFICISFAVILLYTKELFPTNLRGMSAGVGSVLGRFGSMGAPFAVYAAKSFPWLPNVILGVISIAVGLSTLLLPETRDCVLPQDLDDIHDMYKKQVDRRRTSVYQK